MSGHDEIRALLALAAAGGLDEDQGMAVARHAAQCPACAEELREWAALAAGLGTMARAMAPAGLAAAAIHGVEQALEARAKQRFEQTVAVALGLFSWAVGLAMWPIARVFAGDWVPAGLFWWAVFMTVPVWLTAGVAAVAMGRQCDAWRMS